MNSLDAKLNEHFDGKVVRKDLLHQIKKGTNVPTFVLEFLLARYCASDDPAEILVPAPVDDAHAALRDLGEQFQAGRRTGAHAVGR